MGTRCCLNSTTSICEGQASLGIFHHSIWLPFLGGRSATLMHHQTQRSSIEDVKSFRCDLLVVGWQQKP